MFRRQVISKAKAQDNTTTGSVFTNDLNLQTWAERVLGSLWWIIPFGVAVSCYGGFIGAGRSVFSANTVFDLGKQNTE